MQYFGGKQRIAPRIAAIINSFTRERPIYIEPFVGSAAVTCLVKARQRIASDANTALIKMWIALASGWDPPEFVSESDYQRASSNRIDTDPLTAFIGFGCSFAGKWFGGYARGNSKRNYAANARNSLNKKLVGLAGVQWVNSDYRTVYVTDAISTIIYLDPPYKGTTGYAALEQFDSSAFWNHCRTLSATGSLILVSEYEAPPDFLCVAEFKTKLDIRDKNGIKQHRTEKLFTWAIDP